MAFGTGAVAAVSGEVLHLGASRVLLLSTPPLDNAARAVRHALGSLLAAEFDGAAMHTGRIDGAGIAGPPRAW
jgi:hypothetical protein